MSDFYTVKGEDLSNLANDLREASRQDEQLTWPNGFRSAAQASGRIPLYDTTGNNTDGAMTQKAVTDAISNISEDKIFIINVTLSSLIAGTSDKSFTEISNAVLQEGKIPFVYVRFLNISLIAPLARLEENYAVFTYEDQTVPDHQNYACLRIHGNNVTIEWRDKYVAENELVAVAFSGDYNDLSNQPIIPLNVSDLINDVGYLTAHQDLSSYALLASPALTGVPTAPTAATGTNTTQIATTAFVQNAIGDIETALDALL